MNPMSALYHIAQNEPPTLTMNNENQDPNSNSTKSLYTKDFISFIALCLQKNPNDRPLPTELMNVRLRIEKNLSNFIFLDFIYYN